MKSRPMIFSAPMVRAVLAGQKTQTRRVVKHADLLGVYGRGLELRQIEGFLAAVAADGAYIKCPYGVIGDRLWVRESWRTVGDDGRADYLSPSQLNPQGRTWYEADGKAPESELVGKLRSSMFMPRAASRIELEITGIRVERVQDISEADAIAEGVEQGYGLRHVGFYQDIWESINGKKHPWDSNPWVWVVEFKRVDNCQNCVHAGQGACCGGVR